MWCYASCAAQNTPLFIQIMQYHFVAMDYIDESNKL